MDVIGLLKSSYGDYATIISDTWYSYFTEGFQFHLVWSLAVTILSIIIIYGLYSWRNKQLRDLEITKSSMNNIPPDMSRLRFRKRDKMLYYGRRMLRKVKTLSGQAYGGQGRKRRAVMRFARRILQLKKESIPMQLKVMEPPAEYLEETVDGNDKVPPDALYLLQSIRIFGHFEKPVFLKLCRHTEIINLNAGDLLFKIGDPDDSVFIVQSGLINVFINNADGSTMPLKIVRKGESVTSLLSFIDVLVGNQSIYKSVIARAEETSQVIRLPMYAFKDIFNESPDLLIRVIQVIMVRLQRVTFTALRNYLGLHAELVQNINRVKKLPGTTIKNSPGNRKTAIQETIVTHTLTGQIVDVKPDMLADLSEETSLNVAGRKISIMQPAFDQMDDICLRNVAIDGFIKELGLSENDRKLLEGNTIIKEVHPGTTLINEGNSEDVSLVYLMSGGLAVLQHACSKPGSKVQEKNEVHVHSVHPGEIIGGLAVLTGEASLYTIRARHFSRIALLKRTTVYNIMREKPAIVLDIANSVIRRLSPLVRQCDYALDWMFLESGRAVYRQDETSDCTYIVLSGRLRSVVTHTNGKKEIVGEYGKGDLVGIIEMITETSRTTTVMAVRDSELAKLPEGLFNAIKLRYPVVVTQLISLLSHRILGSMETKPRGTTAAPLEANPVKHKFSTVAIVPVSEDVPLTAFTYELFHSLCSIGPTLRLTSEVVRKTLGSPIMEPSNEYRLTSWLAQQEDRNKIALYQCDNTLSAWTQRCMRQADVILIVGLGDRPPTIGKFEREIDRLAMRTQKELVLLHHESTKTRPNNTVQWLNMRSWVTKHHHIQCPRRIFTRKSQYRINDLYSKVLMSEPNIHSDFSRLARWLTGNSVGLVLGGGGARGAAHVGMMKAIQEAGIPVDMVGGVSIGAFMGALWCSEKNITTVIQKAREWSMKMTQWGRQLLDLTYPITSMFSGRDFNQTIHGTFGDIYIEDLWIPYFNLTTDITASCARVHTHGSLWRYVRASMSLSGYMPPLCDPKDGHLLLDGGYVNNLPGCLWRYVRASMTVAGVLPPFCDYIDGHLLLDGCYINNVPADVMRAQGAAHIIAIDVGSQDDMDLTDYGDDLSGWWLLYKRWNPFTSPVKVPNLPDIQSRLAYVSCVRQLEEVKNSDYCEYIRPPIDLYKTLAFGSFDEIRDVGYVHGKNFFDTMAKTGRLARFNQWFSKDVPSRLTHSLNEYTFTDLAQIVCKVPETYLDKNYSSSDDDDFEGYISEPSTMPMNRNSGIRMKRTGGSLSLSENEIDSDELEIPVPLKLLTSNSTTSALTSNNATSGNNLLKRNLSTPPISLLSDNKDLPKIFLNKNKQTNNNINSDDSCCTTTDEDDNDDESL